VTGPILTVEKGVITEMVRLVAFEVPGVARVGRGGPRWRALTGPAVRARLHRDKVEVRLWIVARPGQPLVPLTTPTPGPKSSVKDVRANSESRDSISATIRISR